MFSYSVSDWRKITYRADPTWTGQITLKKFVHIEFFCNSYNFQSTTSMHNTVVVLYLPSPTDTYFYCN